MTDTLFHVMEMDGRWNVEYIFSHLYITYIIYIIKFIKSNFDCEINI